VIAHCTGADVVLGRVSEGGSNGGVPPEQHFSRMKHSPGSGVLSVKVVSDGPTRILRITDENKKVKCLEYNSLQQFRCYLSHSSLQTTP